MKIISIITGIFTSGFGIGKIISIIKKFSKVKKIIKEMKEAYGEFDDIIPAVMNLKVCIEACKRNKFKDISQMKACLEDAYGVVKEVQEFIKETKDIIAIFK